jgi:hypothetical protein
MLWRDVALQTDDMGLSFGHNSVRFEDGQFVISAMLQERPISLNLRLNPVTLPLTVRSHTRIGEGTINWLVVPRLQATGSITVGSRSFALTNAMAYHDHNWGRWLWGHDFAWEWGFALPSNAVEQWSLVFDRTTNRARTQVLELTLALWKGDRLHRVFSQREVTVHPIGFLPPRRPPKYPRVMAVLAPETTADIPRQVTIKANRGEDYLECTLEPEDVAQLVIPNETDLGVTVINEVRGWLRISGVIGGETIASQGRAIFEFLTP